jgi:hypothetical protein
MHTLVSPGDDAALRCHLTYCDELAHKVEECSFEVQSRCEELRGSSNMMRHIEAATSRTSWSSGVISNSTLGTMTVTISISGKSFSAHTAPMECEGGFSLI